MDNLLHNVSLALLGVALSTLVWGVLNGGLRDRVASLQQEAIEHCYAMHDQRTGEWVWITKENRHESACVRRQELD